MIGTINVNFLFSHSSWCHWLCWYSFRTLPNHSWQLLTTEDRWYWIGTSESIWPLKKDVEVEDGAYEHETTVWLSVDWVDRYKEWMPTPSVEFHRWRLRLDANNWDRLSWGDSTATLCITLCLSYSLQPRRLFEQTLKHQLRVNLLLVPIWWSGRSALSDSLSSSFSHHLHLPPVV